MAVDRKTLAQYRAYVKQMEPVDIASSNFAILDTIPEILAYLVTCSRADGYSEEEAADHVELAACVLNRDELLDAEGVLRPLGYTVVADRLRQMARQRWRKPKRSSSGFKDPKHSVKPLAFDRSPARWAYSRAGSVPGRRSSGCDNAGNLRRPTARR